MNTHRAVSGLRRVTLCALLGLIVVAPLSAQRDGGRRRGTPEERAELEQRFRARMATMLQEKLGLSEVESERLSVVSQTYDERRRDLFRREQATKKEVEALLESGSVAESTAGALVGRLVELRRAESNLYAEEQAALLDILTPVQYLQLQEFREDIGRRIRSIRRGDDDSGRRRGGGGGPEGSEWSGHAGAHGSSLRGEERRG